ncbi:MAG: hypothetical protein AB7O37_11430 [Vicinamibacteria bacterium]
MVLLKALLIGSVAVPVAVGGVVAATGVAVVDVRESGPGGTRIVVPVPLVLAQVAAGFVPQHKARLEMGEAAKHLPIARKVLTALAEIEDAELVRVEEADERVLVRKVGSLIKVHVEDRHGEQVDVSLPIDVLLEALPDDSGRMSFGDAIGALRRNARFTELVEVHSRNGEHVRVSIW